MAPIRFRPFSAVVNPARDVTDIQIHMNQLFENFLGHPGTLGMERRWIPAVDVYETKNEVVVSAELPGLREKDIRVSVTGDLLTIQGERQGNTEAEDGGHYRRERWFGKFERTFSLPVPVETNQVKATYRDGVLTVKLPKVEEIKPKEIKIEAA
ncbi:MAG TPA: Hsp20/alpha crystallin family protein [Methylomirabilota bacterium]|nr:Hsp20/alpha crystallin family protein [Methylomirabilota bacterium]